jgi:hypothetical protein
MIAMDTRAWTLLEMTHFGLFLRVGALTLLAVREGLLAETH